MAGNHANRGRALEDYLDTLHHSYAGVGVYVKRTGPRTKILGRGKVVITGKAPPDYAACVNGRALAFDAKQTSASRWEFCDLHRHQAEDLDAIEEAGGAGFLYVWHVPSRKCYLLPWGAWLPGCRGLRATWWRYRRTLDQGRRNKPGAASLSLEQLATFGHPLGVIGTSSSGWLPIVRRAVTGGR